MVAVANRQDILGRLVRRSQVYWFESSRRSHQAFDQQKLAGRGIIPPAALHLMIHLFRSPRLWLTRPLLWIKCLQHLSGRVSDPSLSQVALGCGHPGVPGLVGDVFGLQAGLYSSVSTECRSKWVTDLIPETPASRADWYALATASGERWVRLAEMVGNSGQEQDCAVQALFNGRMSLSVGPSRSRSISRS